MDDIMNESLTEKLEPCPFCGGEASIMGSNTVAGMVVVICHECSATMATPRSPENACLAWNRRTDATALAAENEHLRARVKELERCGEEYIQRTDPAIGCDYWPDEEGTPCGTCRACLLAEVEKLRAENTEYQTPYTDKNDTFYPMTGKEYSLIWYQWQAERTKHRRQRDALLSDLREHGKHDSDCIAGQSRQGRPTEDGGYETLYGYGKDERWYQRGEWPECTCGLDKAIEEASDD